MGQLDAAFRLPEFLALMTKKLKAWETADDLMDAFKVFDEDGNESVSSVELQNVMTVLGVNITHQEASGLIKEIDVNNDGEMNYEEFVGMMMAVGPTGVSLNP